MEKKTIFCIRHGLALHNILFNHIGTDAYTKFRDTPLLHEGIFQAKKLNDNWKELQDIELVIVSPCARTLDTAKHVFNNKNKTMIAKDFLVEYPLGEEICNYRKNKDQLEYLYPEVDFNEIENNEFLWQDKRETYDELDSRIEEMFDWIAKRKKQL